MRATRRYAARSSAVAAAVILASSTAFCHTTLFAPNGGEQLSGGDGFSILWEVTIAHNLENWDLWYSVDGPDGPWIDIAMELPAGNPEAGSLHSFNWSVPDISAANAWGRVRMDNSGQDYYDVSDNAFSITPADALACDFTADNACDISDLNAMLLLGPVAPGVPVTNGVNDQFDLNGDEIIDNSDVNEWPLLASTENGFAGPYLRGDANLDGVVDLLDLNRWASHRFQADVQWDHGDFDGSGAVDFLDFNLWATNRFQSAAVVVPEPSAWLFWCCFLVWPRSTAVLWPVSRPSLRRLP